MAEGGFFGGFAESFSAGMQQRRLREQMGMEAERDKARLLQDQQQFQQTLEQRQKEAEVQQEFQRRQDERATEMQKLQVQKAELDFKMGFEKAFDPKTPKSYRKYLFQTMRSHLGVDGKQQGAKDFEAFVNGLEDEELDTWRTVVGSMMKGASPGEVLAISKLMASGEATLPMLTEIAGAMQKGQTRQEILEKFSGGLPQDSEGMPSVSDVVPGSIPPGPDDISLTGEPDVDGGTGNFEAPATATQPDVLKERQAEIEKTKARRDAFHDAGLLEDARLEEQKLDDLMRAGEMEPEVRGAIKRAELSAEEELELDKTVNPAEMLAVGMPGVKMTKREAQQLGIAVGTLKPDDLVKLNQQKGSVRSTVRQIAELKILAQKAGPTAIGPVGTFVRSMDSFIEQGLAIPNLAGMSDKEFRKNTAKLARETFNELPEKSAIIQSRIIDLTRSMARARDTGMLSNQDIEDARRQLAAAGGSMEQFLAVLDDMQDRVLQGAASNVEAVLAVQPLDLMPSDQLSEMLADPNVPAVMSGAIEKEVDRRIKE